MSGQPPPVSLPQSAPPLHAGSGFLAPRIGQHLRRELVDNPLHPGEIRPRARCYGMVTAQ
jgi:hypothetical protein